jgi:hypothetical protein
MLDAEGEGCRQGTMTLKRWAPRAVLGFYGLVLLGLTLRAWLKFDGATAGSFFGYGLVLGFVLWRAWRYLGVILTRGRSKAEARRKAETGR